MKLTAGIKLFFRHREFGFRPESGKILLVESGIPINIGIRNPSSRDKDWHPVRVYQQSENLRREIKNLRLSSIPLHHTRGEFSGKKN